MNTESTNSHSFGYRSHEYIWHTGLLLLLSTFRLFGSVVFLYRSVSFMYFTSVALSCDNIYDNSHVRLISKRNSMNWRIFHIFRLIIFVCYMCPCSCLLRAFVVGLLSFGQNFCDVFTGTAIKKNIYRSCTHIHPHKHKPTTNCMPKQLSMLFAIYWHCSQIITWQFYTIIVWNWCAIHTHSQQVENYKTKNVRSRTRSYTPVSLCHNHIDDGCIRVCVYCVFRCLCFIQFCVEMWNSSVTIKSIWVDCKIGMHIYQAWTNDREWDKHIHTHTHSHTPKSPPKPNLL